MFSKPVRKIVLKDLLTKVTPEQILYYYTGLSPCNKNIESPFRTDTHPSFRINYHNNRLSYHDFGTGEHGDYIELCLLLTGYSFSELIHDIDKNLRGIGSLPQSTFIVTPQHQSLTTKNNTMKQSNVDIQIRTRNWLARDVSYWGQFGISTGLLDFYRVYPIDMYWINNVCFEAEALAYDYIEYKDNIMTHKIYQPLTKDHSKKWTSTHTSDVISLWTQLPDFGDIVILAASLKDALTIKANIGLPAIALQGEGYIPSRTVINQLKQRFKRQIIIYDNDEPGLKYAQELSEKTGFENIVLPPFEGGKDTAEMYVALGSLKFQQILGNLIKYEASEEDPF